MINLTVNYQNVQSGSQRQDVGIFVGSRRDNNGNFIVVGGYGYTWISSIANRYLMPHNIFYGWNETTTDSNNNYSFGFAVRSLTMNFPCFSNISS